MEVLNIQIENWLLLKISVNWIVFACVLVLFFVVSKYLKSSFINPHRRITIDQVVLGIGNNQVSFKYDVKDREIAYKLWVELSTRKIGIPFDDENDLIVEIYDSWYSFFKISRELLKEIHISKVKQTETLISVAIDMLNVGLRPHLTKWQAKFRKWYNYESEQTSDKSPQELQRTYPYYTELVRELHETNNRMIEYKNLLHRIALGDEN